MVIPDQFSIKPDIRSRQTIMIQAVAVLRIFPFILFPLSGISHSDGRKLPWTHAVLFFPDFTINRLPGKLPFSAGLIARTVYNNKRMQAELDRVDPNPAQGTKRRS